MRIVRVLSTVLVLHVGLVCSAKRAVALPLMSGFQVTEYASVTDPMGITFDSSGVMYVGRDNRGSGGGSNDPVAIQRVGAGGAPVTSHGSSLSDPDAVLFDVSGGISGHAGSVLVGGRANAAGTEAHISVVRPDQSTAVLFGPTTDYSNVSSLAFDHNGRLLFADHDYLIGSHSVWQTTGGPPTKLMTLPGTAAPYDIAVDNGNRLFISSSDGKIRVYDEWGLLIDADFASGLGTASPIAFGAGGPFGTDLYAINGAAELVRFDGFGNQTLIGSGFASQDRDIEFGPDKALYVSELYGDHVLRIDQIPEPSTLSLGFLALLRLAVSARRRRSQPRRL